MKNLLQSIAYIVANKYNLNVDALLDTNQRFYYVITSFGLLEVDRNTHISKCISSDSKIIAAVEAIKTLQDL